MTTYACVSNSRPRPVTDLDIQVILTELECRCENVSTAVKYWVLIMAGPPGRSVLATRSAF